MGHNQPFVNFVLLVFQPASRYEHFYAFSIL